MIDFIDNHSSYTEKKWESFLKKRPQDLSQSLWSNAQVLKHVEAFKKPWLGVCVDGSLVSVLLFYHVQPVVEVAYLETLPTFLRQGHMKTLFNELFKRFSDCGVWLDVHRDNQRACSLYSTLGFKKTGLRRGYYRDGGDSLLLSRQAQVVRV